MELKRYRETASFSFGHLTIRDMTPQKLFAASMTEIEVPMGADNPPFAGIDKKKVYVGITGEIEFDIGGGQTRLGRGDVLLIEPGEEYSYHNGGYEPGRLLLLQIPGMGAQEASGTT